MYSSAYHQAQQKLVKEIIEITITYTPVLELLNALIAKLDVIVGFAVAGCLAPTVYTRPLIKAMGSSYTVKGSRHPCLEMQDDVCVIPNDGHFDSIKSNNPL